RGMRGMGRDRSGRRFCQEMLHDPGCVYFARRSRTPPPLAGSVTERSFAPGLGGLRFARQRRDSRRSLRGHATFLDSFQKIRRGMAPDLPWIIALDWGRMSTLSRLPFERVMRAKVMSRNVA